MLAASHVTQPSGDGSLCTLDIEASGFGRDSYPIEIGIVQPGGRSFCTLIKPPPHWTHWDPEAERVHGISRETLLLHGRPAALVAHLLNEQLQGCVAYTDAWAHDYPWLAVLFEEAGCSPRFKLESVACVLDDEALPQLQRAQSEALAAMGLTRHRASNDARALQQALLRLRHGAKPHH